jgi:hypothetical protein
MRERSKPRSEGKKDQSSRWTMLKLVLLGATSGTALIISLVAPEQLLSGGVVTWTVVAALVSGVAIAVNARS